MDVVDSFFEGPRAREAFALKVLMAPPWSVRVADEAPLSVVAMLTGQAWVRCPGLEPLELVPPQIALFRGPEPYVFADGPDREPSVVILPGQRCVAAADGRSLTAEFELGFRTWGNSATGSSVMVIGSYHGEGEVSRRLTSALPALAVVQPDERTRPLIDVLAAEVARADPGQPVVLDRLLDVLVVHAVRTWFAQPDATAPAWLAGHRDPLVGFALAALHQDPARPWRLGDLAASVGLSRAALARRFQQAVGESPMAYLTHWRLAVAADLLAGSDLGVAAVARRVGYPNPFTFSTAFKRVYGRSPRDYREAG